MPGRGGYRRFGTRRQYGGSRFWPLIIVAIVLILLLGYCTLRPGSRLQRRHTRASATPSSPETAAAPHPVTTPHAAAKPPARASTLPPARPWPASSGHGGASTAHLINLGAGSSSSGPEAGNRVTERGGVRNGSSGVSTKPSSTAAQGATIPCSSGASTKRRAAPSNAGGAPAGTTVQRHRSASALAKAINAGPREELLSVVLNNKPLNQTDLFLCRGTSSSAPLFAKGSDIKSWRMRAPSGSAFVYEGEKFYELDDIPGVTYHVDQATQTVYISAPANVFGETVVDGFFASTPPPQHTPWGGFFNYDFLGTHATGATVVNGLFEAGLFNDWGVGTSSFIDQNMGHSGSHLIRLDTAWHHDNPSNMTTLTVGDSITRGGMTGLDVRFGGVQYGTNFSTRPYFVTFPMPALQGQAALPSTVDLYVNGLLKSSQQVPSGPFSVPAIPVVTGPGSATLIVHDALGREQVITTSFYASSSLLKKGLNDYSLSLGKVRDNYALDSNDYGKFTAEGLYRHGFSAGFTGEVHGEFSPGLDDVSLGGVFATPYTGVVETALAISHSDLGSGVLGRFGLQRQWRVFSIGANVELASPRFTELGYNGMPAPRRQITVSAGAGLGPRAGSIYASYLDQSSPLFGHTRLVSAGYGVTIAQAGFLNLNVFHDLGGAGGNGLSLSFTLSFGGRTTLTTGAVRDNNIDHGYVQLQKSLPVGTGDGYRVSTQFGSNPLSQAEFDYQNNVGTYRIGVSHLDGVNTYQGELSGGLAFIGGSAFPTRQINSSFGLVELPGIPNVNVYLDNQKIGKTNGEGQALIPNLRPYQNNKISLGTRHLPLGAQVTTLDINAVPKYRSGVIEKFPVTNTRGATFTVRVAGGKYLPAGAEVHIVGKAQTFPVGLNGEVYITGLSGHNTVEATWNKQSCRMVIDLPKTKDPLPDLGTFECKGIHL